MASIDTLRTLFEQIRDERKVYANTANRVGNAFLSMLSYLVDDAPFLRNDKADTADYLLTLLAGAVIGEGNIRLNPDGSITCKNINVEGSAIFNEFVFNQQNVLEGDTYFSDRAIIDSVERTDLNQFNLHLRKMYEADQFTFHENDIIKLSVNNLDSNKTFTTSWLKVLSVQGDSLAAALYEDSQCPGGSNFAPRSGARMARWGNTSDVSRQTVFYISAKDGRFLFLQGVDSPILNDSNYAAFIGLPPELDALKKLPINKQQPYVYARGLIVQDVIRINYQGQIEYTARDCGIYAATKQYIKGYDSAAGGYYQDHVWNKGMLFRCDVENATLGKEPRFGNTEWTCLKGSQDINIDIVSMAGDAFPAGVAFTTSLVATVHNAEDTLSEVEIGKGNVSWTRKSSDSDGDIAWNNKHTAGKDGLTLNIDSTIDIGMWTYRSSVGFICTINLPSGTTQAEYSILM